MLLRICTALMAVALPALAQTPPDFSNKAFATAVGQMLATDSLADRCPEARQSGTAVAAALKDWQARNSIPSLRQAAEDAQANDTGRQAYQSLKVGVDARLSPLYAQACTALSAWIASPSSTIAGSWSQAAAASRPSTSVTAPVKAAAPVAAPKGVVGYGLIQSSGLGYGGMVTIIYKPVVLFTSGDILLDVKSLANPGGIAADKAANPRRWSTWRKTAGKYEYVGGSGAWRPILNNQIWTEPPTAAGLQGRFVATGGTGNTALGGASAVFTQTTYRFLPGGRLVREGLASSTSEVPGASTVAGSKGERAGRYTIEGLTLKIDYDDGTSDSAVLMTHPKDKDIIWINGIAYTRE